MRQCIISIPNIFTINQFDKLKKSNFNQECDVKLNKSIAMFLSKRSKFPEKITRYEKYENNIKYTQNNDILDDVNDYTPIWRSYTNLEYNDVNVHISYPTQSLAIDVTLYHGWSIVVEHISHNDEIIIPTKNSTYIKKTIY